jgi:hypothetical protein
MMTKDLERAILACKPIESKRTGRLLFPYPDLFEEMKSKGVDVEGLTNYSLGTLASRIGGLTFSKRGDVRMLGATPERVEQLRKQVAEYVDKPSSKSSRGHGIVPFGRRGYKVKKARFEQ